MSRVLDRLPAEGLIGASAMLRRLVASDASWLIAAGDEPDIVRWNGVPHPFSPAAVVELIERRLQGWLDDARATFAVTDHHRSAGGYLSIRLSWQRGIGEVGYWLLPSHRHRGLGTDAVRLARDWCFDDLGLTRLQAGVQPGNGASIAVVERLGFTREGLLRSWDTLNGVLHDEWMFSLVPTDAKL